MKECMKPHVLMHSLAGLGIGLILANLMPALASGYILGVVVLVVAVVGDFMVNKA